MRRARDGPAIVVLSGTGGVGKSTVALAWAHRARERYPDGQLHLSLGAFDPAGPADPATLLARMLRSLGLAPERVPADTAESSALFRSLAADKQLLIVLDNAVSAAQARPLLPPSRSAAVIVTARWRLGGLLGDGAAFLDVEPLADEPATALLAGAIGTERMLEDPASVSTLVRFCAGLPIALAMAAARLATRPRWPVARVVEELAQERRRLVALGRDGDSVQGTFDVSYRALDPAAARCYRALGLHPGPDFGVPVMAAALHRGLDEAEDLLDRLVEASLLSEGAQRRYHPHDLIRLHAREVAGGDADAPSTTLRILEWYLAGALSADRVLTPYRHRDPVDPFTELDAGTVRHDSRQEALEWLETERDNLVAAVQRAASDLPLLAWRIADSMWPLFLLRRHHRDRMLVDRVAVECAVRLGDRDREARMLRRWAFAHFDVGMLEEAERHFERSRYLCDALGDQYGVASAVEGLGMVAAASHRYEAAVDHFGQQERLCRELGEHRRTGLALLNLGGAHNALSRPDRAVRHLREADSIFAGLDGIDPYNHARVGIELARALGRLGDFAPARMRLRAALGEMRGVGSPRGVAAALHRLGELALLAGDHRSAGSHLASALQLYEELADTEVSEVRRLLALVPPAEADARRIP
ncbi:tetratricopeptide repeat protein [Phytohabitans houttuyneae]|uniref:tetratricopeptide repeat protein n=1 Tax=Phytohabitans houttuyneae TaxID=1076126 RepID=UPI001FE7B48D|nr:tetratricopeptide repeat protein [Phytohabitans houttuyneae]